MQKNICVTFLLLFCITSMFSQKRIENKLIQTSISEKAKLSRTLKNYKVAEIDISKFKKDISTLRETRVLWKIDESLDLDMKMYPHEIRSNSFEAITVTDSGIQKVNLPEIITYKGYLKDGGSVRITIDDEFIYGKIETKEGILKIDQLKYMVKDKSISSNKIVIYKLADLKASSSKCGTPDIEISESSTSNEIVKSTSAGCSIIELILDCDTDYYDDYGSNSHARMLGEINMIQELYEDDINVVLSVTQIAAFATGNFYTSFNGNTILSEIRNVWTSWPYNSYSKDIIHHFTGKNTGPFGQASGLGVACNDANARAWSEDRPNIDQTVAHEIGHLLDGRHGNGTNCGVPFVRSIMCQGNNKDYTFSAASTTRLTNFIDNRGQCFNFNTAYLFASNGNICVNDTKTVSLLNFQNPAGTNITWSTNNRLQLLSAQGGTIMVVKGIANGQGRVTATINGPGDCGSVVETKNIRVGPNPISVSSFIDSNGWASITVNGGTPPYSWNFNFNSTSGTSNFGYFNIYLGCNGGVLQVESNGTCGTSYGSTYVNSCSGGGIFYMTSVYPNPTSSEINIVENETYKIEKLSSSIFDDELTLNLYDFTGVIVKSKKINGRKDKLKLEVNNLKKGNYLLSIKGRKLDEMHKIVIE